MHQLWTETSCQGEQEPSCFFMRDFYVHSAVTSITNVDEAIRVAIQIKSLDLAFNDSMMERALGIHWHI